MRRRSSIPLIVVAGVLFVGGLALGAGKSSADTSAANTASKFLLTIGMLALVITAVVEVAGRLRTRRAAAGGQAHEIL